MYQTKNITPRTIGAREQLQFSTVRSFEGGLNVSDTDLNMSPSFAKVLDNMERGTDGTLSVRSGTKFFYKSVNATAIVNIYYFNAFVICVHTDGAIYKIDGSGVGTALQKVGGGPFWTATVTFVSFTIFNSDLILCNGKDKPVIISGHPSDARYMLGDYLNDKATGTNINTPIGLFVIAHGQYTCIAGKADEASTLYISAKGTSGTWPVDPAPNDAIKIDLGPRVSLGSASITGMVAYRDKLIVTFERGVLPLNLGVYTGSPLVHTPTDDGFIEEFGCLSHRSLYSVGDDTFYADNIGVNSIARVAVFNTLRPVRVSQLIDELITQGMKALTSQQIALHVFAVYDLRHFRYILFIPTYEADGVTIKETVGYSYTNIPALGIKAWARLRGWKWTAACRTSLQNVLFAVGNKIYAYDFDNDQQNADFLNDPEVNASIGTDVAFEWELPWADFKQRMDIKLMRYIGLDTQGNSEFTLEAYVDNIRQYKGTKAPLLSMDFIGGDAAGFGEGGYGDGPYGGGRVTSEERLFAYVAKFKLLKLRVFGASKKNLKFISISVAYMRGSLRR
jgi:hypothetical protein